MAPCASGFEVEKPLPRIVFALEGGTDGMQVAYYAAIERGLYREAGLDVRIVHTRGTVQAVHQVEEAGADVGTADASAVLTLRARGADVCIIAAVTDKSPLCVYSLTNAGINGPKDLSGKRVAYDRFADPGVLFPLFMRTVGLYPEDVTLVPMERGQRLPSAVLGRIDAFLGTPQEKISLEATLAGKKLSSLLWADHGFDLCSSCLYARESWATEHPALVAAFLQASFQGWAWTLDHPADAAQTLSRYRLIDAKAVAAEIEALKPLLLTEITKTEGMGAIPAARAASTLASMERERGVRMESAAAGAFPPGFLPDPPVLLGAEPAADGKDDGTAAGGPKDATPPRKEGMK